MAARAPGTNPTLNDRWRPAAAYRFPSAADGTTSRRPARQQTPPPPDAPPVSAHVATSGQVPADSRKWSRSPRAPVERHCRCPCSGRAKLGLTEQLGRTGPNLIFRSGRCEQSCRSCLSVCCLSWHYPARSGSANPVGLIPVRRSWQNWELGLGCERTPSPSRN